MSTNQAHVQTSIRRAVSSQVATKPKSAGALRMQRLRRSKEKLRIIAKAYHDAYFDRSFRMLAEDNPKGGSTSARRLIFDAWLEAAHIPAEIREQIVDMIAAR